MHSPISILLVSTASVAFIHALAPDHWMPFAALGKSLKWSKAKLLWITFLAGIGHVVISIVLSIIAILLGFSLSKVKNIEGYRSDIALWLLIGFGIAYMIWGIKQAKEKRHRKINEELLRRKNIVVWIMFIIIILGPCEPFIPLVFLSYNYGRMGLVSVSVIFSLVTIIMMMLQSLLAFMGIQFIKNEFMERYSHAFAGLVIVLTGIFVMFVGI